MDLSLNYRFEGYVFFVYDHTVLKKEEDDLEDAILFFYPHSMPNNEKCLLCGQLMGLIQFSQRLVESAPLLYRLKNEKIAVKHIGHYSFALAGMHVEPDSVLIDQLERLYGLFSFYHGSVDQVRACCIYNQKSFVEEMKSIWEQCLAFTRNYGDHLPSIFNDLPRIPINNTQNSCFMKASHILQACQRRQHENVKVLAGCVLYNRFILCSQLPEALSRCLLLLKANQHHHPGSPIETDFQIPDGVRLFSVYVSKDELSSVFEDNYNSPYGASQSNIIPPFPKCCCKLKHRNSTREFCPKSHKTEKASPQSGKQSSTVPSEKDPFSPSSSQEKPTKVCKAILEDLLLKGFKCCKCLDEFEGDLSEGSVCGSAVEDFGEHKGKLSDSMSQSSEPVPDIREDTLHQVEEDEVVSDMAGLSGGTWEGESGIEVTGSDWQSSTATPFEQTSEHIVYNRHHSYQGKNDQTSKPPHHFACVVKHGTKTTIVESVSNPDALVSEPVCSDIGQSDETTPSLSTKCDEGENNHVDLNRSDHQQPSDDNISPNNQLATNNNVDNDGQYHEQQDLSGTHRDILGSKISPPMSPSSVNDVSQLDVAVDNYGYPETYMDNVDPNEILMDNNADGVYPSEEGTGAQGISLDKKAYSVCSEDCSEHGTTEVLREAQGSGLIEGSDGEILEENEGNADADENQNGEMNDGFSEIVEEEDDLADNVEEKCCEVDGLVHANLFVQAYSEIVLILLTNCDLHQKEDLVKSLWSDSLSQLGELDMLLRNSQKTTKEAPQASYNYLIYDTFDKTKLGNVREPVYSGDLVFCDTAKLLHNHFDNSPELLDVTLRNLHTGIHGRRTLSKEVYFQEPMSNSVTSQRHQPQDASSLIESNVRACLMRDHGIHLV